MPIQKEEFETFAKKIKLSFNKVGDLISSFWLEYSVPYNFIFSSTVKNSSNILFCKTTPILFLDSWYVLLSRCLENFK